MGTQFQLIDAAAMPRLDATRQAAKTASWVVLVGRPSPDVLEAVLANQKAMFLALPDERARQGLVEARNGNLPEHVELAAMLIGAESGEVAWFHYNDSRHNGLVGPDALLANYPNLRLLSVELRPTSTLHDLLAGWEPAAGAGQGLLVLCDDAGLSWLPGAGQTLRRVEQLAWWPSSVEPNSATTLDGLDAALQEQWLVATAPGIWQHDESLAFRASVQAERDALLHEREQLISSNSQSEARIQELEAQYAALSAEREQLVQEREALKVQSNAQQERLDRINSELDEILALIDQSSLKVEEQEHIPEAVAAQKLNALKAGHRQRDSL